MANGALVLAGPTASGKSALAMQLAERIDIEIVSADSAQVYRGMNIGTAKPDRSAQNAVPHHLIDVCEPCEVYSAARFRNDVLNIVPEILERGRLPVIAGGTMLYLKALKEGIAPLPEADESVRGDINRLAAQKGWGAVHEELLRVDPDAAARIKPGDTQRLQRAVEVHRLTGVSLTELHRQTPQPCPFPLLEIGIMPPDRAALHQAIALRFHEMLAAGLVDEVKSLRSDPANHAQLPSMRAVGYRQIWAHLDGETDHETMIEKSVVATRQLAKRQYTWLRSWNDMFVQDSADLSGVLKILSGSTILE